MPIFKVYALEICRDVIKPMRDYGQKKDAPLRYVFKFYIFAFIFRENLTIG